MPSPGNAQININVDKNLKEDFKNLCNAQRVSLVEAYTGFMNHCLKVGKIEFSSPPKSIEPDRQELQNQIGFLKMELDRLKYDLTQRIELLESSQRLDR